MDSLSIKRRLTCILATDAVGYSRHMARDEDGTIRVLSAHRAVIDGIIAFHGGRIVSTAGDSVLAEFSSAVEAVRCAIEIQEALKTRNDSLPEESRMLFRVGVNLGDVVVKNDDLLGDGVNVAARLESIAEPGGICISSSVYDQITGKMDLGFTDIGEQTLKNITRPIRVYRVVGAAPAARPAAPVPVPPPPRSNALLVGAGAAGALLIAAAVAWQMGWMRTGPSDGGRATTAAAAPPMSATAPPAQGASVASADADATRAKAEADAVRIRADAEAIRRQAESDASRSRAEADAARSARTKADADAAAARVRAQAETDAARIRADAEKQAAKPAVASRPVDAAPAVVAAVPPATGTTATPAAPRPASTTGANAAFDGAWIVSVICPALADGTSGFSFDIAAQVKDGYLRAQRGVEGGPDSLRIEGEIRADGSALFKARGLTGDPRFSAGRVSPNTPYGYSVSAQFEGAAGKGKRIEMRPCDLRFAKT